MDGAQRKIKFLDNDQNPFLKLFPTTDILLLCPAGVVCSVPSLGDCKLGPVCIFVVIRQGKGNIYHWRLENWSRSMMQATRVENKASFY
jgi:hypothetical protein